MSTRDMALNIVNMMSEEQLTSFVNLFRAIVGKMCIKARLHTALYILIKCVCGQSNNTL